MEAFDRFFSFGNNPTTPRRILPLALLDLTALRREQHHNQHQHSRGVQLLILKLIKVLSLCQFLPLGLYAFICLPMRQPSVVNNFCFLSSFWRTRGISTLAKSKIELTQNHHTCFGAIFSSTKPGPSSHFSMERFAAVSPSFPPRAPPLGGPRSGHALARALKQAGFCGRCFFREFGPLPEQGREVLDTRAGTQTNLVAISA